jgi:hypothetical protein
MWALLAVVVVGFGVVVGLWWRVNRRGTAGSLDVNAKYLAERRTDWGPR